MAIQIVNPVVLEKISELAKVTGLTKTSVVEKAIDDLLRNQGIDVQTNQSKKMLVLLAQFDRADKNGSYEKTVITWDENGLPT
jgi:antitoxin VapB